MKAQTKRGGGEGLSLDGHCFVQFDTAAATCNRWAARDWLKEGPGADF